jgi:hypothetical protein
MAVFTRTVGQAFAAIVGDHAVRPGDDAGPVDGVVPRWVVAPGSVPSWAAWASPTTNG